VSPSDSIAIAVAVIALLGTLAQAALSVYGPPRLQARAAARARLETYRDPLLTAAYELQARLHNILCNRFIEDFLHDEQHAGKQEAAMHTTMYVFAQFLAWREIIRRDIALLRLASDEQTKRVQQLLGKITETFLSKELGHQFMIWRIEQQGFGGAMIAATHGDDRPGCLGYAEFLATRDALTTWLEPLERDLMSISELGRERLTQLQNLLLALVRELDEGGLRYPFVMTDA
jgi:hypothetical protein